MNLARKYLQTAEPTKLRIGDTTVVSADVLEVESPYTHSAVGKVYLASEIELADAVNSCFDALKTVELPTDRRAEILEMAANKLKENKEDFAKIISSESAKPIKTARVEVDRAIQTFLFSASVVRAHAGEMIALDAHPSGQGKLGFTVREPIGVVAAITPFNFPLNLVAHKLAPAIAAGCPVVLKPAHNTPLTSAALVDLLIDECGLPSGYLAYVPCTGDVASSLSTNEKVAMISFTGSPGVGWSIKQAAVKKKVALELGNNAPVIIEPDADLDFASTSIANSGYSFQGQSCISVQRVFVHVDIYEKFIDNLKARVVALVCGDPLDDQTDVSTLISESDNERVLSWINQAIDAGARLVLGGEKTQDGILAPTILADANDDMDICRKEVFGPLVSVLPYSDLDEAITRANDSNYGLQAAVFTRDISKAIHAARSLDFGGVLINETPTFRADNMPYGGLRDSGNTKEGPAYTYKEMTKEKLIIINE